MAQTALIEVIELVQENPFITRGCLRRWCDLYRLSKNQFETLDSYRSYLRHMYRKTEDFTPVEQGGSGIIQNKCW